MPKYQYVIISQSAPGREQEFDDWYSNQHLPDVCKVDGVLSARRFVIDVQKTTELDAPQWRSLAIYEIESDDPEGTMQAISALANTEAMPLTDALDKTGMVQLMVHQVAAVER